jgi:hypothetical protein
MRRFAIPMLVALVAPMSAFAADSQGRFAVEGVGRATCADYLKAAAEKGPVYYSIGGWIEGYLSATNALTPDTYDITPWQQTDLFAALLQTHCQTSPTVNIILVIRGMVNSLMDGRLHEPSPLKPVDLGGRQAYLYDTTLRRIQQALTDGSFYQGGVDGDYGPGTKAAMAAFQRSAGLEATGLPDQVTLFQLLSASPPAQ